MIADCLYLNEALPCTVILDLEFVFTYGKVIKTRFFDKVINTCIKR